MGDLGVLGIDGLTGRPLPPLSEAEARRRAKRALLDPRPLRYGADSDDLSSAGWGVVLPEGDSAEVRDALGPLLARRREQAGELFQELTYHPLESPALFRSRIHSPYGRVTPEQVPWYLLLVGNPVELPHGFELALDVPHAVGRLAFDDVEDLAAYVHRVVELEESANEREPGAAIFSPTHPGDPLTTLCVEQLATPLAQLLNARGALACAHFGEQATRSRLLDVIDRRPDVLFFVGHGVGYKPDTRWQRRRQGALVCADWLGDGPIPAEETFAAEDLPSGALNGSVIVLFGCHTVGTPRVDLYDSDQIEDARQLTSDPFVGALPQQLLGRHGGAVAVLGHVGRAYTASFYWNEVRQTGAFEDALKALLDGRRLGEAVDGFGQRFADLATLWAGSRMGQDDAGLDLLQVWIAFHDARSWSLLGDPAVRLPAASGATRA